jgi:hypothetical protein
MNSRKNGHIGMNRLGLSGRLVHLYLGLLLRPKREDQGLMLPLADSPQPPLKRQLLISVQDKKSSLG